MNKVFERLKKADIVVRKAVLYGIIFVLALPLVVIVFLNLQSRMADYEGEKVFENIEGPQFETSDGLDSILGDLEELKQLMASSTFMATDTDIIEE